MDGCPSFAQKMPEYFCRKFNKRFPYATRRSKNNFFSMENSQKYETSRTSFFHRSLVLWNDLPDEVKKVTEMEVFKRKLKMWIQHSVEVQFGLTRSSAVTKVLYLMQKSNKYNTIQYNHANSITLSKNVTLHILCLTALILTNQQKDTNARMN